MANEFKVRKGLVVNGSGSVILDVQGSQGQLFSVTDSLSGSLFAVNDISGIPVLEAFSDTTVRIGQFNAEAIIVSGSNARITGSLLGTASWANNATSASIATNAVTASFVLQAVSASFATNAANATSASIAVNAVTASLALNANTASYANFAISSSFATSAASATSASIAQNAVTASFAANAANAFVQNGNSFGAQALLGTNDVQNLALETNGTIRVFISSSGNVGIGMTTPTGSTLTVNGNVWATSFTGSLLGTAATASYVLNAVSASSALTSSFSFQASNASSASFATQAANASSASFATQAASAASASYALSASYATASAFASNALSASYALTASYATASSVAVSASFATNAANASSASFATSAASATSASIATNAVTASFVLQAVSASFATQAANATTASYVLNAISSSFATSAANATTASFVLNAVSASFATNASTATSASFATNAATAASASFATNAASATSSSYAQFANTASSADNFTVRGTLTAQTIVAQVITSSTSFITGSTIFGSSLANTHVFTGSVGITGSLAVNGTTAALGTGTINTVPKFTAANIIGNSNISDNGTLITLGSNSLVSGGLIIGTNTSVTNFGIRVNRLLTGNSSAVGVSSEPTIQSDVITSATGYRSFINTQAATFTVANLYNFRAQQGVIGAGSSVSNQTAFSVDSDFIAATSSNIAFRSDIAFGTGRWNLYMNGTANNFMAGSLGIGTTSLVGYGLRVAKTLTGAINSIGILSEGGVQSDATTSATYFQTNASVSATAFTLGNLYHFRASLGAGITTATVVNQFGYFVTSNLIGATNNYAFYGDIASGAGRWNLFMNGTANNYMAGALGIGKLPSTGTQLDVLGATILSGSLTVVTGSGIEFQVTNTGVRIGNIITDVHTVTGSLGISGSVTATSFTGSLLGTATTASYVLQAVSASFATQAANATTASYVLNAVSSSFATSAATATTASYILNAASASFALSSSYALNASTATSASFATNAATAASSSFATNAATATSSSYATFAATASSADDFNVRGTLTATTLVVQTITSSTDFVTGSTRFGSLLSNTHTFTGSILATGSLTVDGPATLTNLTGSLFGTASWANNATSASIAINANTASYVLNAVSASFATNAANATTASFVLNAVSASFATNAANATTASFVLNAVSASFATNASTAASASFATNASTAASASFATNAANATSSSYAQFAATASSADNFTVRGTLTAQTIVAQTITSSTDFVTGSTQFGTLLTNTHQFTGSVLVTGSMNVIGNGITGSLLGTASYATQALTSSNANTASFIQLAQSASYVLNAVSASFATSASFAPTAANVFTQGGNSFGAAALLGTNDVQDLQFETSGSVRMVISGSNGNVGIGTATPDTLLDLSRSVAGQSTVLKIRNPRGGLNDSADIDFTNTTTTAVMSRIGSIRTNAISSGDSDLIFSNQGSGTLAERVRITSAGSVNIGQAASALQSGGTGITIYGATASEIKLLNATTGQATTDGSAIVSSGLDLTINNREAGSLRLWTSNTERVTIDSAGTSTFSGVLVTSATTASTSTTTGALRSAGGLGVAGAGFFGGSITSTGLTVNTGNVLINSLASGAAGAFVVSNSGTLVTRTAAQVLSDIGAQAALTNPITGTGTSGQVSYWSGTTTQTGSNNLFWDNTNGRLGLGTTSPLNRLHVRGTAGANTQTTLLQLTDTGTGTSNGAAIDFSYSSGNILNARIGASSVSGGGASLAFATAPSDGAAAVTVMTLTKTANVLVGTGTDNGARLQVNGTATISNSGQNLHLTLGALAPTTQPILRFQGRATDGTTNRFADIQLDGDNNQLSLFAPSTTTPTNRLLNLTLTGNVLVNTQVSDGAIFQVNGVTSIQGTAATDGGQLGAELLTSANWTSTDWTGDFATGFTHTTGNTTTLTNTLAAIASTLYQITWTVTNRTAGTFTIAFGGYTSGALSATGNIGPRATTTGNLVITPTTDFNGTIVMSIRVITAGSASVVLRNSAGSANGEIRVFTAGSNTSFGGSALRNVTTGTINAAFANSALASLTSGASNVAVGPNSQEFLTIGTHNTSVGVGTLRFNISGIFNTAIGEAALGVHTSPSSTTAIGRGVLAAITSGTNNTGVGTNAFLSLTTGNSLVALGQDAGRLITAGTNHLTATNSIFIGVDSRPSADGNTNEIVIGTSGRGNGSNTVTIGNSSIINNFFSGAINAGSGIFSATTASTSTTTGALRSAGGLGVAGAGNFGGILTSTTELRSNPSTGDAIFRMLTSSTEQAAVRANGTKFFIEVGGTERFSINKSTGQVSVTVSTASTSTTTGALIIAGGLGVAGAGFFGAGITATTGMFSGIVIVNGNTTITGSLTVVTGSARELQVTNTGVNIGSVITDTHTVTGSLNISGSTTATSFTGSLLGTATTASFVLQAVSASFATSAASSSFASTASFSRDFTVGNTLVIDATLTDYASVAVSSVGSNNLFTQNTGSYTSAFFKYTCASASFAARAGEVVAVWNGTSVQFYDNSTVDVGNTAPVTASVAIVTGQVQFNIQTNTSGWAIKSMATFI